MDLIAVVSGGMDSVTLAHDLAAQGHRLHLLSVNYGQRHRRELVCARDCAVRLGVPATVLDLSTALAPILGGSALTSAAVAVPEGHYAHATMQQTIVPNRNALLLSLAVALAVQEGADAVGYAAHAGDHAVYPDCRPAFVDAFRAMARQATDPPIGLLAPYVTWTKAEIVTRGAALGVPWAATWSCYRGEAQHCGRCSTCVERQEAFALAGVPDPTPYIDAAYWQTVEAPSCSPS